MVKLVNIVSIGHTGSTLLAMCLNTHPDIFCFGEFNSLRKRLGRKINKDNLKLCSFCTDELCPIFDQKEITKILKYYSFGKFYSKYYNLFSHYFYLKYLSKKHDAKFIIDSSKTPKWFINNLILYYLFDSFYIILEREKYGVVNSFMKKNYSIEQSIKHIKKENINIDKLIKKLNKKNYIRISYENLVNNPKETLEIICSKLNISFQEKMLDYRSYNHHIIGGNAGTMTLANKKILNIKKDLSWYKSIKYNFQIDDSWKDKLTQKQLDKIKYEL